MNLLFVNLLNEGSVENLTEYNFPSSFNPACPPDASSSPAAITLSVVDLSGMFLIQAAATMLSLIVYLALGIRKYHIQMSTEAIKETAAVALQSFSGKLPGSKRKARNSTLPSSFSSAMGNKRTSSSHITLQAGPEGCNNQSTHDHLGNITLMRNQLYGQPGNSSPAVTDGSEEHLHHQHQQQQSLAEHSQATSVSSQQPLNNLNLGFDNRLQNNANNYVLQASSHQQQDNSARHFSPDPASNPEVVGDTPATPLMTSNSSEVNNQAAAMNTASETVDIGGGSSSLLHTTSRAMASGPHLTAPSAGMTFSLEPRVASQPPLYSESAENFARLATSGQSMTLASHCGGVVKMPSTLETGARE
ncbi:hypothetical protein CEUSTIGMA_g2644.t1 [Chlamydomonas eustigma]|uniref:Uncharacterized protein n=1 Tax=Chlamydomonas eustigma TaxID=1157962 RepID=A0A250WXE4_9CHLO|nr:hypothetical protein CEUSTIGMA_g2644.t1 [Chlamydomonas eustigma]|eukprot:GAX75200.1 hypothetical protein CEUSTIGMA_g2644.t1 [Chlamydomonas eustigma]